MVIAASASAPAPALTGGVIVLGAGDGGRRAGATGVVGVLGLIARAGDIAGAAAVVIEAGP